MRAMSRTGTGRAVLVMLLVGLLGVLPGAATSAANEQPSATHPLALAGVILSAELPEVLTSLAPAGSSEAFPLTVASTPPLPACRYKDERTRYDKPRYWRKTLLDTNLRVGRRYRPRDLVSVKKAHIKGSGKVRRIMIADLRAMARAARRAGKPLAVRSAYRSYATQVATFNYWVSKVGYQRALKVSARPGHSEHQLGTTIDFTVAPGQPLSTTFGKSRQGRWMKRHAWKFGFVSSYPKGKRKVTCYSYEPWHWRYVGRKLARKIHDSGLVPRRYLWNNFETAP